MNIDYIEGTNKNKNSSMAVIHNLAIGQESAVEEF